MTLNKKTLIPLLLLLLFAAVAGGGWFLWQQQHSVKIGTPTATESRQLYTCSMHPSVIRDNPGLCPICGMELIKKIDHTHEEALPAPAKMVDRISLSPSRRVMANVATLEAKKESLNKEINAVGIVQYDQSRQSKVTAWIAGRLDKLYVTSVGSLVSKESPVAEIYSPDLIAAEQEYLLAIKSREQLKNSPFTSLAQNGEGLVASAKQRLLLFGVKESQIATLEKTGRSDIRIPIYTPQSGVVIEKMVQQGQYVNMGEALFNIADLSVVWVEIEVYENEFASMHLGKQVEIRSRSFPDKLFTGKISLIYPFLDPKTRTIKARVEMANSGLKLKPDMFVNATIRIPLSPAIVLPVTAVMDTGKRQVVWVESSPGTFVSRDVQVGERMNDKVQILSGIAVGEKVAVSGGYLIDSESQLR